MINKIVVATDSFKNSASAFEVCDAIERGIRRVVDNADLEVCKVPISDGGEGTLEILTRQLGGHLEEVQVTGPLGQPVKARYGRLKEGVALIEMAEASGLELLNDNERNPFKTTTYGTGELIRAALDAGARKIIVGLGGSATNDGGAGMAQALGVSLQDDQGHEIGFGADSLRRLASVSLHHLDERICESEFIVLSDVNNPLTGPMGASHVYAEQKGATKEELPQLDEILVHYGQLVSQSLGQDFTKEAGAGAAGGTGFGLLSFFKARMYPGIQVILELLDLDEQIRYADLLITGEGRMDHQTAHGKAPYGVTQIAKKYGVPVIAIVGSATAYEAIYQSGIDLVVDIINEPMTLHEAMLRAQDLIEDAAANAMRALLLASEYCFKQRKSVDL